MAARRPEIRPAVATVLRAAPQRSDRDVAAEVGCSRDTVGAVRRELVRAGAIPPATSLRAKAARARARARALERGGHAICEACGLAAYRERGEAAPYGWEAEPLRCGDCVAAGRMPAPVTVRFVEPAGGAR